MFVDLTPEQHALRGEIRDYFNNLLTPAMRAKIRGTEDGDEYKRIVRQIGADGWLAVGWPREYGGQGYGATEQLIFFEEACIAGAMLPFVTINTVGPALMAHGSEEQKQTFLPGMAEGRTHFAIGYSEPGAGSDLATIKTRAKVEDDHFVVNGHKMWTSGATGADYIWLAARTNPDKPRHKGISIMIVDTQSDGFSATVVPTCGPLTGASYYDDVKVPRDRLVGELDGGWKLITAQLNHERLGLGAFSDKVVGLFRRVYLWAKTADEQGKKPIDAAWVKRALAECYSRVEAMRLLSFRIAGELDDGHVDIALASASKVYGSESVIEILRRLDEIVGASALVRDGTAAAVLQGELEYETRGAVINTFGGGTNEIQRELIARFGMGMPRTAR